jgi:adenylate kinase family enzyme
VAERVLVYGVTGSGKTTLARRIAERSGLPWHSVDDLTWEPGWIAVSADEQRRRISAICAGEQWVLDSAYSAWLDVVLGRTDLIVALDYQRWRSLGRLLRRTAIRAVDHRLICNGNTESVRQILARDSIIAWHFRSLARKQSRMRAWAADPAGPPVILLSSPGAARDWLADLGRGDPREAATSA